MSRFTFHLLVNSHTRGFLEKFYDPKLKIVNLTKYDSSITIELDPNFNLEDRISVITNFNYSLDEIYQSFSISKSGDSDSTFSKKIELIINNNLSKIKDNLDNKNLKKILAYLLEQIFITSVKKNIKKDQITQDSIEYENVTDSIEIAFSGETEIKSIKFLKFHSSGGNLTITKIQDRETIYSGPFSACYSISFKTPEYVIYETWSDDLKNLFNEYTYPKNFNIEPNSYYVAHINSKDGSKQSVKYFYDILTEVNCKNISIIAPAQEFQLKNLSSEILNSNDKGIDSLKTDVKQSHKILSEQSQSINTEKMKNKNLDTIVKIHSSDEFKNIFTKLSLEYSNILNTSIVNNNLEDIAEIKDIEES